MIPKGKADEEVNGVDTIQELVGSMPKELTVRRKLQLSQQVLMQDWNATYIAIIPYCFKCKVPLMWHLNPKDTLFHCPTCRTRWIKGEGWNEESAKQTKDSGQQKT